MKKTLSIIIVVTMLIPCLVSTITALNNVGTISGESGRTYEDITLSNGTKTGVKYTQMNLSGTYGSGKILHISQCDLANTNLSIDVINCGSYTVSTQTVAAASKSFSANGKTVLSAINGDLWMTGVNSNTNVTKSVLKATRGILMIDGEVWATQEFGMENYMNTSNASTTAAPKSAFGVTNSNQPLVGIPVFSLYVTNETKNKTVKADGLNRLPAWDSLVVYNHRINSSNYALNDSYEVVLECNNTAFKLNNKVTATVKAIYPSGSTTRPSIASNTIILTARGSRMEDLSSVYSVGDVISFDLSVVDEYGNTDLWYDVNDAIGGHMQVINDGSQIMFDTRSSEYPTSFIGIRNDGTVMFAAVGANTNGAYKGLRYKDAYQLCTELGYNSVFYLDGGGSSSIVTLKNGTYTKRNYSSDGSARAVINAVAMVWNNTPVCEKQGSLAYITQKDELSNISPYFLSAGILKKLVGYKNDVNPYYVSENNALRVVPNKDTVDPYFEIRFTPFSQSFDTSKAKYITVKLKTNVKVTSTLSFYYITSDEPNIQRVSASVSPSNDYVYVTIPMASAPGWSGTIVHFRIDLFEGITSNKDCYADIEYIAFSGLPKDTSLLKSGSYPLGSIPNYYAYKDCCGSHTFNTFSQYNADYHRANCEMCGYSTTIPHSAANDPVTVPSTCTSTGSATYYCKDCSLELYSTVLEKTDHQFSSEYTVDIEPTPTTTGQKSRHCLYCSEVCDIVILPATKLPGDLNDDSVVNSKDSNILQKVLSGNYSNANMINADVNNDNKVNAMDMQILKRVIAGVISIKSLDQ